MSLTTTTTTISNTNTIKVPEVNTTQLQALAEVCSSVNGWLHLREKFFGMNHLKLSLSLGAESMTMPNIVMNSLISSTKVITNDTIPNPIVSSLNTISLPTIPVPVSSIGIPVMTMKIQDAETDIEVTEAVVEADADADVDADTEVEKVDLDNQDKDQDSHSASAENLMSTSEPMECASVNSMASPKHTMATDVVMAESGSVNNN